MKEMNMGQTRMNDPMDYYRSDEYNEQVKRDAAEQAKYDRMHFDEIVRKHKRLSNRQ